MRFVEWGILLLLAAIFLFSGIDKILHYDAFVNAVRNYVLVPRGWAPYLAPSVILVELMIGAGLLLRSWRRPAALTAAVTLAVFTAALTFNYIYGERGICGCWFTITLAKSTELHLAQNLLFLGLALSIWWDERGRDKRASPLPPASALPVAAAGLASVQLPLEHPRPGGDSLPSKH